MPESRHTRSESPEQDLSARDHPESDHPEQDLSARDHPESDHPEPEPPKSDQTESDQSKSDRSKSNGPRKRRAKSRKFNGPQQCIQHIRYKFDKRDRRRHIRPYIEYIFSDGQRAYEPNTEDTSVVEVELVPINGIVWMSRFPINFISPTGEVITPLGEPPGQHIIAYAPWHEPRNVLPSHGQSLQFQPPQGQAFPQHPQAGQIFQDPALPNELVFNQPAPSYPHLPYAVPSQYPSGQPLPGQYLPSQNPQQFPAEAGAPVQLQAGPITPVSPYGNNMADGGQAVQVSYQEDRRPVHQVANQQVKSISLTSQDQQFIHQQGQGPSFPVLPDQIPYQQGGAAPYVPLAHQVDYRQDIGVPDSDPALDPTPGGWNLMPNEGNGDEYNLNNVDTVAPLSVPDGELAPWEVANQ